MNSPGQKLSLLEKVGYSGGDAAANFVFLTMIYFQANFYTDVFGITAGAAATILLVARLWDAVIDPVVGVLADRTNTRWGKFRPWILGSAVPWCVVMVLAYTTPVGWGNSAMIAYAAATNILLMSIYSMNNMPYAALGAVLTGDVDERNKLNAFRFISVNMAQFAAGGLTLPLVARFSIGHDRQYGWRVTMSIWAVVCLILFIFTFVTTTERIRPQRAGVAIKKDFATLLRNSPWAVLFFVTMVHCCILSFRGSALYNYYHYYADKAAMYEWLRQLGLTASGGASTAEGLRGILETLGYMVHGDATDLRNSNVADVFNSIINMTYTVVIILVLMLAPALCHRFGKKAIVVAGFGLSAAATLGFYLLGPKDVDGMFALTVLIAACYAPTIPSLWAMYADVADYSEWQTGRRFTGVAFATLGFALKTGLALGSSAFLWIMAAFFRYDTRVPELPQTVRGFRICSGIGVGCMFLACTILLLTYKLNKRATLQMARELNERRSHPALA